MDKSILIASIRMYGIIHQNEKGYMSHPTDWKSRGIELATPGFTR